MCAPGNPVADLGQFGGGVSEHGGAALKNCGERLLGVRRVRGDPSEELPSDRRGGLQRQVRNIVSDTPVDLVAQTGQHRHR